MITTKNVKSDFIVIDRHQFEINSKPIVRDCVNKQDGVCCIVKNTANEKYVFVKQFRVGSMSTILEAPAGIMDCGLSAEKTMEKEILEETGYKLDKLQYLLSYYSSVGYSSEKIHLYYGEVSEKSNDGGGNVNENEFIEVVELTKDSIKSQDIVDGKTLIGLMKLDLL